MAWQNSNGAIDENTKFRLKLVSGIVFSLFPVIWWAAITTERLGTVLRRSEAIEEIKFRLERLENTMKSPEKVSVDPTIAHELLPYTKHHWPGGQFELPAEDARRWWADYFLPYQTSWLADPNRLRIIEKSRQIGLTHTDALDSILKATHQTQPLDVYVSSRDEELAIQYIARAKRWLLRLQVPAQLGLLPPVKALKSSSHELRFENGKTIFSLSSNPDAFAGRPGHIKIDEFAIHREQRELFTVAKPCIQWGGSVSLISTHRGVDTIFNELIRHSKTENIMGFSLHSTTIHQAVEQGIVEKINKATGQNLTRGQFLKQCRDECIDENQWLQEYCCIPTGLSHQWGGPWVSAVV